MDFNQKMVRGLLRGIQTAGTVKEVLSHFAAQAVKGGAAEGVAVLRDASVELRKIAGSSRKMVGVGRFEAKAPKLKLDRADNLGNTLVAFFNSSQPSVRNLGAALLAEAVHQAGVPIFGKNDGGKNG